MSTKKQVIQTAVFLLIMCLTFSVLFRGKDLKNIWNAVSDLSPFYFSVSVLLALAFVALEGGMIWYLLRTVSKEQKCSSLWRCIQYSFIGFFYSGITPSATGGQPVQLYYMNRDGNRGADSTVVLMTVAAVYKFVLVLAGTGILLFCGESLRQKLGRYFILYLFGLLLNVIVVSLILAVMLFPAGMYRAAVSSERFLVRIRILKPSGQRAEKISGFIDNYKNAVALLKSEKGKIAVVVFLTAVQRSTVFVITYMVYRGFGFSGIGAGRIILLQASVYIAVDMLPLPGAQGITELMYQSVFSSIFSGEYLLPSMLVSRGINFYFLMAVSFIFAAVNFIGKRTQK